MANTLQTELAPGSGGTADAVSTAKDKAGEVVGTAGEEARAVARDAADHARALVDETRDRLRGQASEQTERLSGTLRDVAEQLRSMVEGRGAAPGVVSDLASQLASTVSRTASRLEDGGVDTALDDAKRFARNRPGTFLAVAVGAGFVAGRLFKASDTQALAQAAKPTPDAGAQGANGTPSISGAPMHASIGSGTPPLASDAFVGEP